MNSKKTIELKAKAIIAENTAKRTIELYYTNLKNENERLHSIIKQVRELVNNFDVFKEFTFPLMKRDEEAQVKSSIDYEWNNSIKKPILQILKKESE